MATNEENAPQGESIGLTDDERTAIDAIYDKRLVATHYDVLGVGRDADRRAIRDAYFALSKRFHPDVFFKREMGPYKPRLDEVFRALTRAYDVLSNSRQRAGYDLHLASIMSSVPPPRPTDPPPDEVPTVPPASRTSERQPASAPPPTRASEVGPGVAASPARVPDVQAVVPARPLSTSLRNTPIGLMNPEVAAPVTQSAVTPPPLAGSSRGTPSTGPSTGASQEVVVPPPLRTSTVPVPPNAGPPARPSSTATATAAAADPAVRQRAMEAMARRLGVAATGPRTTSSEHHPAPPRPSPQAAAEERRGKIAQLVANGEDAQRKGNLDAALESFRAAANFARDDESIKLRIEQISEIQNVQRVSEYIERARDAMRAGKADEAAQCWERAWEGRPNDATLLLNAAEVLARYSKDHKRAVEIAQRVLLIDPRLFKAYVVLATAFTEAGLRASARGAIENAAKLEPNNPAVKELRDKLGPMTIAEQLGLRGR